MYDMNSGYNGWSMSDRAVWAYDNGEKPLTKFTKNDVEQVNLLLEHLGLNKVDLKVWQLKEWLKQMGPSSWHHTSMLCNKTNFYSITYALSGYATDDIDEIEKEVIIENALASLYKISKTQKVAKKKPTDVTNWYYAYVEYGEWEGTRSHPKLQAYTTIALIYNGWAYLNRFSKKKVNGSHFYIRKELGQRKPKEFDGKFAKELKAKYHLVKM